MKYVSIWKICVTPRPNFFDDQCFDDKYLTCMKDSKCRRSVDMNVSWKHLLILFQISYGNQPLKTTTCPVLVWCQRISTII